jgi:hypothetical protein
MGAPVNLVLPTATAMVTATGPAEDLPTAFTTPPDHTTGTIMIHLADITGTLTIKAGDFTSPDETGHDIALRPATENNITATTGHPSALAIVGCLSVRHAARLVVDADAEPPPEPERRGPCTPCWRPAGDARTDGGCRPAGSVR